MPNLSCGIIGLPNVGKSTLFNALTQAGAEVAAYPFCTIEPNVGVVPVRDKRLDRIAELVGVHKIIYHTVEYVDVAGLVKDASKGAGRGNQFLEHVRNCDALVHVVRCFNDPNVAHIPGEVNPVEDIRTVSLELILADIETCDRALDRLQKRARREADAKDAVDALQRAHDHLDNEKPIRTLELSVAERELLDEHRFLTAKSVLYACNVDEEDLPAMDSELVQAVHEYAQGENSGAIPICARIEEEVSQLETDEAQLFLDELGFTESGLQRLAGATSKLLGLISFFTYNDNETRAWKIRLGSTAQEAAGAIHTDFAEKFIRAEVTAFEDFDREGGKKGAHEHGLTRTEGRDYSVRDGDVIYFRVGP